jgi:thiosulfate/3-mercaptopyruvate sulfurtransferase
MPSARPPHRVAADRPDPDAACHPRARRAAVKATTVRGLTRVPSAAPTAAAWKETAMKPVAAKFLVMLALSFATLVHGADAAADTKAAASIPAVDLLEPEAFAKSLQSPSAPRPLILQVGFRTLYVQAHIPGSEYAGPTGQDPGLKVLRDRVAKLAKDAPIVLYCGCCPWSRCPNIAAAYDALRGLGFSHVKVLHIDEDFGANWADKGYPVAKGE